MRIALRGEDFLVTEVHPVGEGHHVLEAQGISELVRGRRYRFDSRLEDIRIHDPAMTRIQPDTHTGYARIRLFLETRLRHSTLHSPLITIAGKAAIDPADYQLEPTVKALRLPRPRILIADGVGLGKTIEVGIFLAEMMKRGRGDRILVLALRSILGQFQQEIWQRFAIPLMRLDSEGISRVKAGLPLNKNPFDYYDKVIVSIDTLKNNAKFQHYLEKSRWDIIVIDECHTVANLVSQRGNLAQLLATRCEALVLTSATPHNGKRENFANLLRMIEPTAIPRSGEFTRDDIEAYYVRRFKNDIRDAAVRANFQDRQIVPLHAELLPAELEFLRLQQELKLKTLRAEEESGKRDTDDLFTSGLFKAYMSSPEAAEETLRNRLRRLREAGAEDPEQETAILALLDALTPILERGLDSKYRRLKEYLDLLGWAGRPGDDRIVLFAERLATLKALERKLRKDYRLAPAALSTFDGSLPDTEQHALIEDFGKEDSSIRLLLTSDAGSQGVNLHYFCHRMINYDIPWSLITLEQRNGRIDRYGQTRTPEIGYLLAITSETGFEGLKTDLHIVNRLTEKEEEVYRTLGDAGSVMHLYDPAREEALVRKAIRKGDKDFADRRQKTEKEAYDDFFASFGAPDDRTPSILDDRPIREEEVSLFDTEQDFYETLLDDLVHAGQLNPTEVTVHPDRSIDIIHTRELDRILYDVPPEARPLTGRAWQLTGDRVIIQKAIAEARRRKGDWARFQMLYDLHPLVRYLMTKLEASVDKHVALAARTSRIPAGQLHYVFHGQVANQLGQQVISRFFAVGLDPEGGLAGPPMELADFLQHFGLRQPLVTHPMPPEHLDLLQRHLDTALRYGRTMYMDQRQQLAQQDMEHKAADYARQVQDWADASSAQLELEYADKPATVLLQGKRERQAREIRTIFHEKSQYYRDMAALDNQPYLQLLAVLYNL